MVRHVGGLGLPLCAMLWISLASSARAQTDAGTPAAVEPPPSNIQAPAPETESTTSPVVLFLMPSLNSDAQRQLHEALLAQFTLIDARLVFEPAPAAPASLGQRVQQAQALAALHSAIAAFWIEEQPDGHWFVHMMDSQQERIIVRQVDAANEKRPAAIETVALMARESTRALIEGVPQPAAVPAPTTTMLAPPTPPPAAPAPTPSTPSPTPPSKRSPKPLRLSVGYFGNDFAREMAWQNGIGFGASWLGLSPFYAGVGYTWTPTIVRANSLAVFDISRLPFSAFGGYRYVLDWLALDAELGLEVDRLTRSSPADMQPPPPPGEGPVHPLNAHSQTLAALTPRLRVELRPLPGVGLYLGGGIDILLSGFEYIFHGLESDPKSYQTLLKLNRWRPMAEGGVAFYP